MAEKKEITYRKLFMQSIYDENQVTKMLLGLCPALAVSNSAENGLAMGLATAFVVFSSSSLVSLVAGFIPKQVRIPTYIVIIAGFVSLADLFLKAMLPDLAKSLGPYVPLIVVNCMIMGRAEFFASKNKLIPSMIDALGVGIGFTWCLALLGAIREVFGSGSIFGYVILGPDVFTPWIVMLLPGGAFLTLGIMVGVINYVNIARAERRA